MLHRRLFAVIHVESREQAIKNAEIAQRAGCDGIFLISHRGLPALKLVHYVPECQKVIPFVGVNFLDLTAVSAVSAVGLYHLGSSICPQAVWTDTTYYRAKPESFEVFGGYAFKYQPQPVQLAVGARRAVQSCHVLTTSGPGTGKPADVLKVQRLREAIGEHRLALASGVTVDNVGDYLPYVDDYLVATGISSSWAELDPELTRDLAQAIHGGPRE